MIKNEYLENYFINKEELSEFDKEKYAHDDDRLINSQRPLSQRSILKLPKVLFKKFLEDLISNKGVNELLYSTNARKESSYNKKQTKFIEKATKYTYKRSSFLAKSKDSQNLFFKKKKAEMFEIIKKNILESRKKKENKLKYLIKKNKSFERKSKKEIEKRKKLEIKKENVIKLEGYKRAVETCLNKSDLNNKFKMPDNSFNINDVFCRLYNNVIIEPISIKTKIRKTETSNYNSNNLKKIRKIKLEDNQDKYLSSENININKYKAYSSYKNVKNLYDNYKIKNILNGYNGKEFSREKNFIDYTKCIKKISGGPKMKRKFYNKIIKRIIKDKKLDIKEKEFDINSYRDRENNSFLNIAVKKNNTKFVKYFLNKNYNPNEQNKDGNTAVHLSMKRKNKKIIKLLLDKKGDITIKNKDGMTSYDLADKDLRSEFKMENILVLKRPKKYYY